AGLSGRSISFCDQEQLDEWKAIRKLIGKDIEIVQEHPFPMDTTSTPAPKPAPSNQNRSPRRNFRRR
ncbi:MAG: ATP-dependent helicase, partial [Bacteroidota bacterium]